MKKQLREDLQKLFNKVSSNREEKDKILKELQEMSADLGLPRYCSWNDYKYTVYGRTPDGNFHIDKPLFETDEVNELVAWFNTPWEER